MPATYELSGGIIEAQTTLYSPNLIQNMIFKISGNMSASSAIVGPITYKGNIVIVGGNLTDYLTPAWTDCIIDCANPDIDFKNGTHNRNTFSIASWAGGTKNNCQFGGTWTPPAWPTWVEEVAPFATNKTNWALSTLMTGAHAISTYPEPGTPPYTGYATDLWGTARNGIGTGFMGAAVSAPVIDVQPSAQAVAIDGTLTISVAAHGDGTLHYQWKQDGDNVGTDSDTYTVTPYDNTSRGSYTVDVTNLGGTTTSNSAAVTTLPTITVQPADQNVEIGGDLELTVTATGYNTRYQWKKGVANVGTNSDTYSANPYADTDAGSYTVVVTSDGNSVTSDAAVATSLPTITNEPATQAVVLGGTLTLSVTTAPIGCTFQWMKDESPILDETNATYIKSNFANADRGSYTCVVTYGENTLESDAAVITTAPYISVQPVSTAKVAIDGTLSLSVTADGYNLSYQWKQDTSNVGTNSNTLTITPYADVDRGSYTCVVTSDGNNATSNACTVTTNPAITVQPLTQSVVEGGDLELSVTATGHPTITYLWKKGGSSLGVTTSTLSIDPYADINRGSYTVDVTCDGNTVTSNAAVIGTVPTISVQPVTSAFAIGDTLSLSVTASPAARCTYQWYKDATLLVGDVGNTLSIINYDNTMRGSYTVAVTCDGNTVVSDAAVVTTQPAVTTQPITHGCELTLPASLVVVATGYNQTYQWYKSAAPISGATGTTLSFTPFAQVNRGDYHVDVTSDGHTVSSNTATITVKPYITSSQTNYNLSIGDSVEFSVTAIGI